MMRACFFVPIFAALLALPNRQAGAQWVQTNGPYAPGTLSQVTVTALTTDSSRIFAGTEQHGVFLSTNKGLIWESVNSGLPQAVYITSFAVKNDTLLAGTRQGLYLYDGTEWIQLVNNYYIGGLSATDSDIFAGFGGEGLARSTDSGKAWRRSYPSLLPPLGGIGFFSIVQRPNHIYAGGLFRQTDNSPIYPIVVHSSDNGTSWGRRDFGLPIGSYVKAVALTEQKLFAAAGDSIYRCDVDAGPWVISTKGTGPLATLGKSVFAGAGSGLLISLDEGTNWTDASQGLGDAIIKTFLVTGQTGGSEEQVLFAGTTSGVWKRPVAGMIPTTTSMEGSTGQLPTTHILEQNYPNPFNPETRIKFSLATMHATHLDIFNILGQHVRLLVSEQLPAGQHELVWDGRDNNGRHVASGVYLYRIMAGSFLSVKRMMLVK